MKSVLFCFIIHFLSGFAFVFILFLLRSVCSFFYRLNYSKVPCNFNILILPDGLDKGSQKLSGILADDLIGRFDFSAMSWPGNF